MEEKLAKTEIQLKNSETKYAALEKDFIGQIANLKDQLRDKNIEIRDIKRNKDFLLSKK
jgi:hypothetical protein